MFSADNKNDHTRECEIRVKAYTTDQILQRNIISKDQNLKYFISVLKDTMLNSYRNELEDIIPLFRGVKDTHLRVKATNICLKQVQEAIEVAERKVNAILSDKTDELNSIWLDERNYVSDSFNSITTLPELKEFIAEHRLLIFNYENNLIEAAKTIEEFNRVNDYQVLSTHRRQMQNEFFKARKHLIYKKAAEKLSARLDLEINNFLISNQDKTFAHLVDKLGKIKVCTPFRGSELDESFYEHYYDLNLNLRDKTNQDISTDILEHVLHTFTGKENKEACFIQAIGLMGMSCDIGLAYISRKVVVDYSPNSKAYCEAISKFRAEHNGKFQVNFGMLIEEIENIPFEKADREMFKHIKFADKEPENFTDVYFFSVWILFINLFYNTDWLELLEKQQQINTKRKAA